MWEWYSKNFYGHQVISKVEIGMCNGVFEGEEELLVTCCRFRFFRDSRQFVANSTF